MSCVGTAIFSDPDDYAANFREVKINLVFTGRGDFKARQTWVELPNLHLFRCQESLPRIAYVSLAPTQVVVSFPTRFDTPQIWAGVELHPGDIVLHSLGERMHQLTHGASGWASVSMAPEFLFKQNKLLAGQDLVLPPLGRVLRPPGSAATQLRRLHEKACRLVESKAELVLHREVTRALEQDILHTLINCLTAEDAHGHAAARQHHSNIMVRFEEWLTTHLERSFHMPELCAAIGIPERTLRMCCAEFLGMSPNRYLRLRRLNLVRTALQRADPETASVKALAMRHGFSQFGRFAVLYRMAFGEVPSATLRRSQPNAYLGASAEIA